MMILKFSNKIIFLLSTILVGCFGGYPMADKTSYRPAKMLGQFGPKTWLGKCVADCLARTELYLASGGQEYMDHMGPTTDERRNWCETMSCAVESEEIIGRKNSLSSQFGTGSMSSTVSNCEIKCLKIGNDYPELRRRRKTSLCRNLCAE